MTPGRYRSMESRFHLDRRQFFKAGGAVGAAAGLGLLAARSLVFAQNAVPAKIERPKTNVDEALKVPRTKHSLPGPFPGRVVEVHDPKCLADGEEVRDCRAQGCPS